MEQEKTMRETQRSSDLLKAFVDFCELHPDLHFWEALRRWCGYDYVCVSDNPEIRALGFDVRDWTARNGRTRSIDAADAPRWITR